MNVLIHFWLTFCNDVIGLVSDKNVSAYLKRRCEFARLMLCFKCYGTNFSSIAFHSKTIEEKIDKRVALFPRL